MDNTVFKKGRVRTKEHKPDQPGYWELLLEQGLIDSGTSDRSGIFASAAGLCARQTAGLVLAGEQPYFNQASSQFYFSMGSTFEDVVTKGFKAKGIFVDAEARVESIHPEHYVSGRIDFVINDPKDMSELVLVELKSCGKLPEQPRHYQLAQLKMYMCLTGVEKGLLWYISRHVAGFDGKLIQRVFEVTLTDEQRRLTLKNWLEGAIALQRGELPVVPAHLKKWKCGFCLLKPQCWGDEIIVDAPTFVWNKEREAEVNEAVDFYMDKQGWLRDEFYSMYGYQA